MPLAVGLNNQPNSSLYQSHGILTLRRVLWGGGPWGCCSCRRLRALSLGRRKTPPAPRKRAYDCSLRGTGGYQISFDLISGNRPIHSLPSSRSRKLLEWIPPAFAGEKPSCLIYIPGQAHPVDGSFGLPFPRFPRANSIAAASPYQVPIIDLVGWNTHRPPLPTAGPANPICSLSAMGDSGGNHGSGPVRIPHLHALQAMSMCVICGRFIFYFTEFNV